MLQFIHSRPSKEGWGHLEMSLFLKSADLRSFLLNHAFTEQHKLAVTRTESGSCPRTPHSADRNWELNSLKREHSNIKLHILSICSVSTALLFSPSSPALHPLPVHCPHCDHNHTLTRAKTKEWTTFSIALLSFARPSLLHEGGPL